jgi:NAD(P)-dependent dehydrogenase (short-subunit alcohol dehydrogenase family)/aryl carrier-like protein
VATAHEWDLLTAAATLRLLDHCLALYRAGSIRGAEPIHAFDATAVQKAFRRMQGGASIGKIVIRAPDDHDLSLSRAHAQVKLSPDRSYLLIGGLGGIGRPIATWLVENGARHLVFFSRSAGESADDQGFFKELIAQGTSVTCIKGDVSRLEDVERIEGCSPAPIGGIFQLAMVLKDSPTLEMTYTDWNTAVTPKVAGTWNIHRVFKDSYLDFLVLMSSIAGIRGYPGQANYAAANSFLNGFAHYRHAHGLPCSVINLGVMDEVGFVARTPFVLQRFREQGTHILTIRDLIDTIHIAVRHQHPAGDSGSRAHNPTHMHVGFMPTHDASRPGIREDVRLSLTRRTKLQSGEAQGASEGPLRELLSSVAADNAVLDSEAGLQVLRASITRMFCSLLSMQEEDFDPGRSVVSLGMDSLVKIEVRRWWRRYLGLDISIFDIANAPSVNFLIELSRESLAVRFGGAKCRN